MSRKDFEAIAAALRTAFNSNQSSPEAQNGVRMAAFAIAAACANSNRLFNRNLFLAACGIQ